MVSYIFYQEFESSEFELSCNQKKKFETNHFLKHLHDCLQNSGAEFSNFLGAFRKFSFFLPCAALFLRPST